MMKTYLLRRYLTIFLSVFSLTFIAGLCDNSNKDPKPNLIDPTDAKKVGAALIVPDGTQTKEGTPPAPSTSAQAPKVTPTTTEQPTANGNTETVPIRYSNLNGGIGGAYAQVEGASTYYDIPVSGNAPASGTINLPFGIPDNFNSGSFTLVYCIYDRSGRVSNILRIRFTITRVDPLDPGEGRVTVGGRSVEATAACDLDFGGYGRAYVILTGQGSGVVLYNMHTGSNQLANFESLADSDRYGDSTPFAGYVDGSGKVYFSVSGSATVSGKKASVSGVFKDPFGSSQISVSASGNCQ